jgi:SAM-dependent methyltransferase
MSAVDPDEQRAAGREAWEGAAAAWGRNADRIRRWGLPVSVAMVESLDLQPGQRVLELAAGPGDTGFLAAELIRPGGTLISSDGAEAMLEVAQARAAAAGLTGIEFTQLELEWIDLPTASVDAILCRWGIMLIVDPAAAAHEARRVLRARGHAAFAVWDERDRNPWATIPSLALAGLGLAEPADPDAPGNMFSLAGPGRLSELLGDAGFLDVEVAAVPLVRTYEAIDQFVTETADISPSFATTFRGLDADQQAAVGERIAAAAAPFIDTDGSVALPGSSLVATAGG